ncbi:MAG: hypothetical protein E7385_06270 [Ruminococcaceae bacterium]|nr:hypothetical protein [Oscillospiraceae bacterium]
MSKYENGYSENFIVGFNTEGKVIPPVGNKRQNRHVGIFYFLWLEHASDIYLNSEIIEKYGAETLFHKLTPESPHGEMHWWGEPLFGFYRSDDEWVIRKHMEMLMHSGIDFLVFDATNALTYNHIYIQVLKVLHELNEEGWNAPKIAFMTHSISIPTITKLYNELYSQNLYPDTWYMVNGKPMIIGYWDAEDDMKAMGNGDYKTEDLDPVIREYFYIRKARWPMDPVTDDAFPFVEWQYPQPLNGNLINVSIASHPMPPFSFSLTHDNWCNWGRGYNVETGENVHEDIIKGTFFDSQWKTVHEVDPELVFVTGWNEWVAQKFEHQGEYMFCDNVDMEYSRDAEPMRGGYGDAYYIQMMSHIRKYKYLPYDDSNDTNKCKTIDICKGAEQWEDIDAVYRNSNVANITRDSQSISPKYKYIKSANRNNIRCIKVTSDCENIYMSIECTEDIQAYNDSNWMNIFIGTGMIPSQDKGWEGYEYAINRYRTIDCMGTGCNHLGNSIIEQLKDGKYGLDKECGGDCSSCKKHCEEAADSHSHHNALHGGVRAAGIGLAPYTVSGKLMQIQIPKEIIGDNKAFYFKVADGVDSPDDIMSYYESGCSMPVGRLSYIYKIGGDKNE